MYRNVKGNLIQSIVFFFNLTIKFIECNNSKFLRRNIKKNVFSISKSDNTKLVQNIHYAIRHATDLKDKH